ncbi:MAG: phosphorylated adapter RNA export RNA-binding domain-containing protein [Caldilinea sp.]
MNEGAEDRHLDEAANPEISSVETLDPNVHPVDMPRIRVIATELQEPNIWLIRSVAAMLGMEAVETIFQRTQAIEAAGGMMTKQGDRRRTSGGVFFLLAREQMTARQRRKVFGLPPNPLTIKKQPKPATQSTPPKPPAPPKAQPPTLEQAVALLRAILSIDPQKRGIAVMKTTIIGRPKQIKKLDTCTLVVLGQKAPPAMPKGLPPVPDTSKAAIAVFVANKQWEKVEAALKEDPTDEAIIEGYPVNDPKNQLTGVWAQSCTSKNLQRAKRAAQLKAE